MIAKITLSYNGVFFRGWASQPHREGVQDYIQKSFKHLGITSKITSSGRTDKGVHALAQVIHINLQDIWSDKLDILKKSLNKNLKHIYIKNISLQDKDFHARFSAKKRVYRYIISTKKSSVFNEDLFTFVNESEINKIKIKKSISLFLGEHNFEFFKKQGTETKTNIRVIYKTSFYNYKHYYIFVFVANSFLRNQIRLMVNFLLEISKGNLSDENLISQLNNEKIYFKKPAPPNGLYLSKIIY